MRRRTHERHRLEGLGWLRAGVLGANDGIVSTSSLILGVAAAHAKVRERVAPLTEDRPLYKDIAAIVGTIQSGALVAAAEERAGRLL